MGEYIVREALLKHKTLIPGFIGEYVHVDRIIEAPAADVQEVRHGKWIRERIAIPNMHIVRYRNTCSECGGIAEFLWRDSRYNYCHCCGAKMDLEEPK